MPPTVVIDRLRDERDEAREAAIALAEADNFDPASESFRGLETRAAELDTQIEHLSGLLDRRTSADALDGRLSRSHQRQEDRSAQQSEIEQTWGELFVRSDQFTTYPGRGTSGRLEVRALPMTSAGFTNVMAAGPQINNQDPDLPPLILSAVTTVPVSTNAVEFVVYNKTAGGADVVAEGAVKPSAEWAPTVTPGVLDNVAVWTQMSRQLMEDASAVTAIINQELRREVIRKAESEAHDAINDATLPSITGPAGSGIIGAIRAGAGAVQNLGFSPNAFLIHGDDLVVADLAVMNSGGGSGPNQTSSYWGLRPVVDPQATKGTVTVGDFRSGVQHYTRSQVALYVTDSHGETFTSNIMTLLAEQRSKTLVVKPGCLCEATKGA